MSQPESVRSLADRVWARRIAREPYYRLREDLPVDAIPAGSLAEAEEDADFARATLAELAALPAAGGEDLLTREFLEQQLGTACEGPLGWWASFPVTPYVASGLAWCVQQVFQPFRFEVAADVDRYRKLLGDYARGLHAARARLEAQAARGWRIPQPALPGVLATLRGIERLALAVLPVPPARFGVLGEGAANAAGARIEATIDELMRPAFAGLITYVEGDYARGAPELVGLHQYPGGAEAYAMWVRQHMTYEVTPERVHATGLEEVARLTEAMAAVRASLGFAGSESEFHEHLRATGRLYAKSAEEVEARYRRCIERMKPLVGTAFRVLPRAAYDVKRLDASAEAGMSYGYYEVPSATEPRGLYRYNGSGLETRSQLSAAALIYHELVPGHHFHLARQAENDRLPAIRRHAIELTVFNEGWAEYASGLAGELGLYDDPYDRYGRLIHERFTAQRLVTDTGLNAFGWPLARAREYMQANTLESPTQVATETLRYSTDLPGQALAYRIGYLRFMELREQAKTALGSRFDLADFHEAILGVGALPFAVLERHVGRFIQAQAQESAT